MSYIINKTQIANAISGAGVVEICPDGIVSCDDVRLMIVPHSSTAENNEIIHLTIEQTEQISKEFFPGGSIAEITGGECSHANITMNDDELNIGKLVSIGAPQDKPMPEWRKVKEAFIPGSKAMFDLDILIDLLQRLKKSSGEKNLYIEIDIGNGFLSRISANYKQQFPAMRPLPYAYIMQCKTKEDNDNE